MKYAEFLLFLYSFVNEFHIPSSPKCITLAYTDPPIKYIALMGYQW